MSRLEHSPAPWSASNAAIYDSKGLAIAIASGWQGAERRWDANSELLAAAPTMYRILRAILDPNKAINAVGLMDAAIVLGELEGWSDAEA